MKCPICQTPLVTNGCPYHTLGEVLDALMVKVEAFDRIAEILYPDGDEHAQWDGDTLPAIADEVTPIVFPSTPNLLCACYQAEVEPESTGRQLKVSCPECFRTTFYDVGEQVRRAGNVPYTITQDDVQ